MRRLVAALAALTALSVAPDARAAAVGVGQLGLLFVADPGEQNRVTIERDGDALRVTDEGAIELRGCDPVPGAPAVRCPAAGVTRLNVLLHDGDDALTVSVAIASEVYGGPGADLILSGDGDDLLAGGPGRDTILAAGGDDQVIEIDADGNVIDGGPGADRLAGGKGPDEIRGGPGDDPLLFGDLGDDLIDGGEGDDVLDGGPGPRELQTDADRLLGGPGADTARYAIRSGVRVSIGDGPGDGAPGEGDDVAGDIERLVGSGGPDELTGGPGDETIDGGGGGDVIDGGPGDDVLEGGTSDASADTLRGGEGADRLSGGAGGDTLDGGAGADELDGGGDDDALAGGADADTLRGGDGDDRLEGGPGADVLSGGPGTDTVRYPADAAVEVTIDGVANDGAVRVSRDGRTRVEEGAGSEGDNVDATNENVTGTRTDDTVAGDVRANALAGGAGEDYLNGRGGADALDGGASNDAIVARDGRRDRVSCGAGTDYVVADPGDRIARAADCEYVDDGSTARPTALRDVTVAPRCGRGRDADISTPKMRRSVPLRERARVPTGTRVDSLDCAVVVTAAVAGGRTRTGTLERGSGAMAIGQRRAGGRVLTTMRSTDCAGQVRAADVVAGAARYPLPRYRRRYGRFAIPVELRLERALIRTGRGVVRFVVDHRCGRSATVSVSSGRLTVVDLARDRTVVVEPGRPLTVRTP